MDPIVQTRQGAVRGSFTDDVYKFKGIPYAAPPFGPNRLQPPRPVPGTARPRTCTNSPGAPPRSTGASARATPSIPRYPLRLPYARPRDRAAHGKQPAGAPRGHLARRLGGIRGQWRPRLAELRSGSPGDHALRHRVGLRDRSPRGEAETVGGRALAAGNSPHPLPLSQLWERGLSIASASRVSR